MKTTTLIISLFIIFLSCKKKTATEDPQPQSGTTTSSTSTTSNPVQTSIATITVTSGTKTTTITGSCGWASAAGVNYIGSHDQNNNLRAFEASFNIQNLPTVTTTYSLVAYNSSDTDPTHVSMSISEQSNGGLLEWDSSNSSGTMKIVVAGNKYTVNLVGISLSAQTNSGFYTNLNTGEYANAGVLSGTLTFYK